MTITIDWSVLRGQLQGELITPNELPLYDVVRMPFNARIDPHPAAVARCLTESDVVACVKFCVANGISITCRSGGHGSEGYCSVDDELMIDLSAMQTIQVDLERNVVHVGGGSCWGQVDLATYPRGLAAPGGGCQQVGVGGLSHGGGFGPIARKRGLTLDNIVQVEIVTARDQEVIIANEKSNPDLFWALRGGGGGNFGAVTKFTYRLEPIGRAFAAGQLIYAWGADTKTMFRFYRDWMNSSNARDELTLLPIFAMTGAGDPLGVLSVFYNGDYAEGFDYVLGLMKQYNMPIPQGFPPNTPMEAVLGQALGPLTLLAYTGTESTTAWPGSGQFWKSGFLKNDFPDEAIDTFMTQFELCPKTPTQVAKAAASSKTEAPFVREPNLTFGCIESLGGAIGRIGKTDTAFFWRDQRFSFTFIGIYDDFGMQHDTEVWATNFRKAMEPYFSGGVYVNYMQADLPDFLRAYYGDNYPRLRDIKKKFDPNHVFRFPQDLMQ